MMRSKRSRWTLATVAVGAVLLVAGCTATPVSGSGTSSGAGDTNAKAPGDITIGSIVYAMDTVPFLAKLADAETQEAAKLGVKLKVVNGGSDATTQVAQMQQYIASKVDLILLTTSNGGALIPAVKEANAAGIPVIAVNTPVPTDKGATVVTYVGADDYTYGVGEGNMLVDAIGGKGDVALILGVLGTTPQVQRTKGIKDVVAKHTDIHIVTSVTDSWQNAKALSVTQDLLSKYPKGKLQAIIAEGPELYVGAEYAASIGRTEIKFIAGDYPTEVEKAIKAGTVYGTVNQSPVAEAVTGVQAAVNWLTGKKDLVKTPNMNIPLPNITKENVDSLPAEWTF